MQKLAHDTSSDAGQPSPQVLPSYHSPRFRYLRRSQLYYLVQLVRYCIVLQQKCIKPTNHLLW